MNAIDYTIAINYHNVFDYKSLKFKDANGRDTWFKEFKFCWN